MDKRFDTHKDLRLAMSDKKLWYGFLEAGNKSTPVVLDQRLETGNPDTIYLFNLKKKEVLEYKREIVEPKLRELKPKEAGLIDELKTAFGEVKRTFKPRDLQVIDIPERSQAPAKKRGKAAVGELPEGVEVDIDIDDEEGKEETDEDE